MRKLLPALFAAWLLTGCSIQIADVTPAAGITRLPPTAVQAAATVTPATPVANASLPWAALGLKGRLVVTEQAEGVWQLSLATGSFTPIFQPPAGNNTWVNSATVSPDGQQIIFAYAPPPPAGQLQFGYTDLYVMPVDGSAPAKPWLARQDKEESYFSPDWAPDGKSIYYAHLRRSPIPGSKPVQYKFQYTVERMSFPSGQAEVVANDAYWPRLSRDGTRLAYVSISVDLSQNRLFAANADGSQAHVIAAADRFAAVDSPLFTPDNQAILFSAVNAAAVADHRSWWDWLTGVEVAWAHNVPSDWWRVPLDGGPAQQLTRIADTGLYGAYSPDGQRLVFSSASAIAVMDLDGQNLHKLMDNGAIGSVNWVAP